MRQTPTAATGAPRVLYRTHGTRATTWDGSGLSERTEVATPHGAVRLDRLRAGGEVLSMQRVSWRVGRIDRETFRPGSLRWSRHRPPVRIEAGALGGGLPREDVTLGGEQGIVLDGVVWPALTLVTGTTIRLEPEGAPQVLVLVWPEAGHAPP